MRVSFFCIVFFTLFYCWPSFGKEVTSKIVYTGYPNEHEKISSVTYKDTQGQSYTVEKDLDDHISKIYIFGDLGKDILHNNCLEKIYFPDLQSVRITVESSLSKKKHTQYLKMDFFAFADKEIALDENNPLKDFKLKLAINNYKFVELVIYDAESLKLLERRKINKGSC